MERGRKEEEIGRKDNDGERKKRRKGKPQGIGERRIKRGDKGTREGLKTERKSKKRGTKLTQIE